VATQSVRIAVIVPCWNDGEHVEETVDSVLDGHEEPLELVVVDDASDDEGTHRALDRIRGRGIEVACHEENRGVGAARNTGLEHTTAPFVFPLDSDDLVCPGALTRLADLLEAHESAAVAYGDYEEFGEVELLRAVPDRIDPYRLAYTNEYPPAAMFRRSVLEDVGGWDEYRINRTNYEDWDLWMKLAEQGRSSAFLGHGVPTYRQRVHGPRLLEAAKLNHGPIYRRLRARHRMLYLHRVHNRRHSDLSRARKLTYPIVYGRRPRFRFEPKVKSLLDRTGIWTLQR
jgi:glycosyltransferase involved in cell wall biosynthesis